MRRFAIAGRRAPLFGGEDAVGKDQCEEDDDMYDVSAKRGDQVDEAHDGHPQEQKAKGRCELLVGETDGRCHVRVARVRSVCTICISQATRMKSSRDHQQALNQGVNVIPKARKKAPMDVTTWLLVSLTQIVKDGRRARAIPRR